MSDDESTVIQRTAAFNKGDLEEGIARMREAHLHVYLISCRCDADGTLSFSVVFRPQRDISTDINPRAGEEACHILRGSLEDEIKEHYNKDLLFERMLSVAFHGRSTGYDVFFRPRQPDVDVVALLTGSAA